MNRNKKVLRSNGGMNKDRHSEKNRDYQKYKSICDLSRIFLLVVYTKGF